MVANRFGAQQKTLCPVVTTQAILVSICAYPLMLVCIPIGFRIFDISGIAAVQAAPQRTYFSVLLLGSIISLLRNCFGCFFSGIGRTRTVMVASFVSMAVNVGLNYLLIFGKAGFPALGILGAAIGTVTAGALGLAVLIIAYVNSRAFREYEIRRSLYFDKDLMKELWRRGYPSGLEMLLNLIAFTTLITTFHACGTSVATAITITFSWDMVSFVPMIGLNIAVMSLAGRYCGSKELHLVYRSAWSGMKCSAMYSCLLMGLFLLFPGPLVDLFLPETGTDRLYIREMAIFMVRLICVYVFGDGILQVFGGALRGTGDTLWVMVMSLIMHWTFALIAVAMLHVFGFDPKTTWVGVICVFVCYGPIFLLRFQSGRWKKQLVGV
jgi:MATE family multidrug resistance protein